VEWARERAENVIDLATTIESTAIDAATVNKAASTINAKGSLSEAT